MDFRFVTPRKNPDSEADIFRGYYGGTDFSFVFTKEVGYATFDKPVFALLVINGDDNGMYIFSLSDFDATGPEQLHFKAGWYWFDITSVVLEPVDFYTAFPDGIVFPQNIERPNPTFCETILFETGTTACKLAVLEETKLLMRLSIASKGVDVPDTTPFRQYAGKVGEIGGSVAVDFNNPESYVDTYTYTDEDAVISTESNLKGNLVFGYFNFITNDFVWGSSGAYGMSSQANMMTPTPLPTEQTVLVTYDGVESAIVFDPVEKRISTTEYRTGSMTITVYKKM